MWGFTPQGDSEKFNDFHAISMVRNVLNVSTMVFVHKSLLAAAISCLVANACTSVEFDLSGQDRADEGKYGVVDPPILATHYGIVLNSSLSLCETKPGDDVCKDDKRVPVRAKIVGLAQMQQDLDATDISISLCRVRVQWDEKVYRDQEYLNSALTLANFGEVVHMQGIFGRANSDETAVLSSGVSAALIGMSLEEPVGEDVPTDADDARVIDQDSDDEPGVSLKAPIGQIFLGARILFDLPLHVSTDNDGSLRGALNVVSSELSVFDDSIPFVDAKEKLAASMAKAHIVSQDHQVIMMPGYEDCDGAVADL